MAAPLPADLPVPEDDGAAEHLPGAKVPAVALTSTDGAMVRIYQLGAGRTVLYVYPLTGRADVELPEGWDAIPGARGCTNEACDFRDPTRTYSRPAPRRCTGSRPKPATTKQSSSSASGCRSPCSPTPGLVLATELGLPTFTAGGMTLYRRHTLVLRDGVIEHVFYPVFPPDEHAEQVLTWLSATRAGVE